MLCSYGMGNALILNVECCICHKVHGEHGWVHRDRVAISGRVSHGYCPSCYRKALVDLEKDFSLFRLRPELLTEA